MDKDGKCYSDLSEIPSGSSLILLEDVDDYTFYKSSTLDLFGNNINGNLIVVENGVDAKLTCSLGRGIVKDKEMEVGNNSSLSFEGGRFVINPTDYVDTLNYEISKGVDDKYYKVVEIGLNPSVFSDPLCFTAKAVSSKVKLVQMGAPDSVELKYATVLNGQESSWTDYTFNGTEGTEITLGSTGDKVYFRAKNTNSSFSKNSANYYQFVVSSGQTDVSGNVMSLVDALCQEDTVSSYEFYNLFKGNIGLQSAEKLNLPVESLAESCYEGMFSGCSSLTKAPALPATILAKNCYKEIFKDCSSLTSMSVGFTSWDKEASNNWLDGAGSANSVIKVSKELGSPSTRSSSTIPDYWKVGLILPEGKKGDPVCFTAGSNGTKVWVEASGSLSTTDLAYSLDKTNWFQYTTGSSESSQISLNANEKVYFKAKAKSNGGGFSNKDNSYVFKTTGSASVSGNIMYLVDPTGEATEMSTYVFKNLFKGNTGLTSAENLALLGNPLTKGCYEGMFSGCTSLTKAPALPATTLAEDCYKEMFKGCSGLTTAPELPATSVENGCYSSMFNGCSILNSLTVGFASWSNASSAVSDWLSGTASSGKVYCSPECDTTNAGTYVPSGWTVTKMNPVCFTANQAGSSVTLNKNGSPTSVSMVYSTDGIAWSDYIFGTTVVNLDSVGSKVYFRVKEATSGFSTSSGNYYRFTSTGNVKVEGNVMYLVDPTGNKTSVSANMFYGLFYGNSSLTDAGSLVLPATTLAESCYESMFSGCTTLTGAPALSATALAKNCYKAMFFSCVALTTGPALPATTLAESCYESMFSGCITLTGAPILPATTLAKSCYKGMFSGCTSLVTAPSLSVETLKESCYEGMFSGCTSLVTAPELPATTLVTYCYKEMFSSCSSLSSVTVGFTAWGTNTTTDWLKNAGTNVAGEKPINCPKSLPENESIPSGWVLSKAFDPLHFIAEEAGASIHLDWVSNNGNKTNPFDMLYSTDGTTWQAYTWTDNGNGQTGQTISLSSVGSSVYFKYNGTVPSDFVEMKNDTDPYAGVSNNHYLHFVIEGGKRVKAAGSVMSLVDGTCKSTTIPCKYCFIQLFSGCSYLTEAPELPATTLKNSCYSQMFDMYSTGEIVSNLTKAPELPAQTLSAGCYFMMFRHCVSLQEAPVLPAKTLVESCYQSIFYGCSSLNYVKIECTDWSASSALSYWMSEVSSTGDFYGPSYSSGFTYVPSGWTRHDI